MILVSTDVNVLFDFVDMKDMAVLWSDCGCKWLYKHIVIYCNNYVYRLMDANDSCINAEIRTRIPDIIPHDYVMEDEGGLPTSFAVKVFSRFILSFG